MKKKIVFVGISGGVDSAVSAALLKEQGYDVVGVFIKTWHPDFLPCNEEEERRDAMRVAAHLDIPFLTFDFEEVYKKSVADYMIQEYKIGRTPNPDVMCNKEVKFGAFFERAISMGADFVAMGHYAQISTEVENTEVRPLEYPRSDLCILTSVLKKGLDPSKDQSYFLWNLKQEQLSKILFPIGNLKKNEVRKLAKKFNLPVAQKKDSQGLCFLGAIDIKEFLKHYIKSKKGKVLNEKGEIIGFHPGATFFTLGERHGFTITQKGCQDNPYHIISKNIKNNTLAVSQDLNLFLNESLNKLKIYNLEKVNWINEVPYSDKNYTAQIRYHGEFLDCRIEFFVSKKLAQITFTKPVLIASGQSCVIYDEDIVLGGGIVC